MERLPAEVVEGIIAHLTKDERLALRTVCHRLNTLILPRLPVLWPPEQAHFSVLKLQKLPDTLHISLPALSPPMAQHLVPLTTHATRTWKRWNGEKIDCFSTFSFPSSGAFSLFEKATIGHLEVAKLLPLYVEDGNLQQLQQLLQGCTVDRTTLVFDHQTMRNLRTIPSFLRSISCRSVEFILERTDQYDMLAPYSNARFAASLVSAGVREVVLSGVHTYGREQPRDPRRVHWKSYEKLGSRVLSTLFKAGIRSIEVGPKILARGVITMTRDQLDALIDSLTPLPRPLRLSLHLYAAISDVPMGRYERADDEEHRRSIMHHHHHHHPVAAGVVAGAAVVGGVAAASHIAHHLKVDEDWTPLRGAWGQRITIELAAEEAD